MREPDGLGLRMGLTVTKRVGNAVERNRIKRRLRAVAKFAASGTAGRDADVVVIARRDVLTTEFDCLADDLRRALAIVTKPRPGTAPA